MYKILLRSGQFVLNWIDISYHPIWNSHYIDVIMTTMASQITSLTAVYSTIYSDADQRKKSKLRVTGLCVGNLPGPVKSPHKGPVTRKMLPFDGVIMDGNFLGEPYTTYLPQMCRACTTQCQANTQLTERVSQQIQRTLDISRSFFFEEFTKGRAMGFLLVQSLGFVLLLSLKCCMRCRVISVPQYIENRLYVHMIRILITHISPLYALNDCEKIWICTHMPHDSSTSTWRLKSREPYERQGMTITREIAHDLMVRADGARNTRPGDDPVLMKYFHDDVIKWKHFPRHWPFVREFTGPGEFPAQRPVTRSFDVFFDLRLNKRLSDEQPRGWWFETPSWSLWRHFNVKYFNNIT